MTYVEHKQKIAKYIIDLKNPFKVSELYKKLEEDDVSTDKEASLEVLDELYQNGHVDGKELADGSWGYESVYYR